MSIIAVKGVPTTWTLKHLVILVAKVIRGPFEALNFGPSRGPFKTAYLRLSETLDSTKAMESINRTKFKGAKLTARFPDHIPNIALATKAKKVPLKWQKQLKMSEEPGQILITTHFEILVELQSKYTGLFNLSRKSGHKLMGEIAQTVFERLKHIMDTNEDASSSCFKLSKAYRKSHPHFADFQLVLSTLHRVEDAAGAPRTQLLEHELAAVSAQPYVIDNVPYEKVQKACTKYSERITKKVTEHIQQLNCDVVPEQDNEEDIARKRVREELKKISPYLAAIVKQVIYNNFVPQKSPYHRMRIYGEPFLPSKEVLTSQLKRFGAVKIMRSDRVYNLVKYNIPMQQYAAMIAMDGTVIGGAKLVIRSSDIPLYKPSTPLVAEMKTAFGAEADPSEDMDIADMEDWTEEI